MRVTLLAGMPRHKRRRRLPDGFLEQDKSPVFTSIAALTAVIGWVIIVMDLLHTPRDWGGLAQGLLLLFILVVGSLFNALMGWIAAW